MAKMFPSGSATTAYHAAFGTAAFGRTSEPPSSMHPLEDLIERFDMDVVHPAARPGNRPERQPSTDALASPEPVSMRQ